MCYLRFVLILTQRNKGNRIICFSLPANGAIWIALEGHPQKKNLPHYE